MAGRRPDTAAPGLALAPSTAKTAARSDSAVRAETTRHMRAPDPTTGRLDLGWTLIERCNIGAEPSPADLVLINPAAGIALLQLEPHWTPDGVSRLRAKLQAAGFATSFPGHLPIIHRRLRAQDVPEIRTILSEAFSLQDPLGLPEGHAWAEAACAILTEAKPGTDAIAAAAPEIATPEIATPELPTPVIATPEIAPPVIATPEQESPEQESPEEQQPPARQPQPVVPPVAAMPIPQRSPRRRTPAVVAMTGLAAGVLLFIVFTQREPTPPPPDPALQPTQVAANTHIRSDAVVDAPQPAPAAPPVLDARPQAEPLVVTVLAPIAPFEEPPEPNITAALAAPLAAPLAAAPPPVPPFEEPPEPNIAAALAAPLAAAPPPLAPFAEPPEPNIAAALAAAPPPAAPFEEPPEPNIAAALAAAPPPVAPFEEPPEPNIAAALAAAPPPAAPFEEPPEPNIAAALAAAPPVAAAAPAPPPPPQATPPQPAPAQPAPAQPAPAQPAPARAATPPSPLAMAMLQRGTALLEIGDISGARRFFERAADSGSSAAALAMGGTYDPRVLATLGARGIAPDTATALTWYRRAQTMGEPDAASRIASLETAQ